MNIFALIIRVLFIVSTIMFLLNVSVWVTGFFQSFQWVNDYLEWVSQQEIKGFGFFGLYAGAIGLVSSLIYGLSTLFKKRSDIKLIYVLLPVLYGIIWIILIAWSVSRYNR